MPWKKAARGNFHSSPTSGEKKVPPHSERQRVVAVAGLDVNIFAKQSGTVRLTCQGRGYSSFSAGVACADERGVGEVVPSAPAVLTETVCKKK